MANITASKLSSMIEADDSITTCKINFLTEKVTVESELSEDAVREIVRAYAKIDDSTYYNSEAAIQDIKFDNGSSDVTFNDGIYQIVFPNDPLGNIK